MLRLVILPFARPTFSLARPLLSPSTFVLALLAASALSVAARAQDGPSDTLACAGPFASDSTHARLVAAFGAKNVTFEDVDGPEGSKEKATVLFGNEPTRRVQVYWRDERARAQPLNILVSAPSQWVGPLGITIGLTAAQVEKINGKGFLINGFGWEGGGFAGSFDGRLATLPGGCRLSLRFEPTIADPLPERYAPIMGDKEIPSANRLMRRAKPMVQEWSVGYGR